MYVRWAVQSGWLFRATDLCARRQVPLCRPGFLLVKSRAGINRVAREGLIGREVSLFWAPGLFAMRDARAEDFNVIMDEREVLGARGFASRN